MWQNLIEYCVFQTIRRTPPIWEENGGVFYSQNVAYLAHWGGGRGGGGAGFFPLFSSSKT